MHARSAAVLVLAAGMIVTGVWAIAAAQAAQRGQHIAAAKPSREDRRAKPAAPRRTVEEVQRCLADAGYYDGPIDGKMSNDTWKAFWFFKHENGLKAYSDPFAPKVSEKLFTLCAAQDKREAALDPARSPVSPESPEASPPVVAPPEPARMAEPVDCLFPDLADALRKAQKRQADVALCATPCLPKPQGLGQQELDLIAEEQNIAWCQSCVVMSKPLPLDDILKLERASGLAICVPPQDANAQPALRDRLSDVARSLCRGTPRGTATDNALAVVIGNTAYDDAQPGADRARASADSMVTLLVEHLRYAQDNVIDLRDAKLADFERVFGKAASHDGERDESELSSLVKAHPEATLTVFYAGRGVIAPEEAEPYLVPVDAPRHHEAEQGYPLSVLLAHLAELKLRSALVLLESSFASDHAGPILAPNAPFRKAEIAPQDARQKVAVIAAATGDQRTLGDPLFGVGLFTRYAIEALSGRADIAPLGNADREVDLAELYAYTAQFTRRAAMRSYGLLQQPAFSGLVRNPSLSALQEAPR